MERTEEKMQIIEISDTSVNVKTVDIPDKYEKAKKYNAKLFPIYKMFSWDLIFYYTINFLFLTQAKGLSASNVLVADAFYMIFKLFLLIPCTSLAEKIGYRKGILVGTLCITISILLEILSQNLSHILISYAVMAFGYSIKELCDSTFLRDCITAKEHPGTAYTSIDGKGSAYYYLIDAITSISCGFLFVFNKYLPLILCLIMCIISSIIAFNFKSYRDPREKERIKNNYNFRTYIKDLRVAFKNIFRSDRLKALFLFTGAFSALLSIRSTVASSLFTEVGVKEEYFGVIFACLTVLSSISARHQDLFHKKFRNKLLTYFSVAFCTSLILVGIVAIFSNNFIFTMGIILFCYAMQYIIKAPYYTLRKRYLNSFSSRSISAKIFSANILIESLSGSAMCYIASLLLDITTTARAIAILGCVSLIAFIFILDYMKDRIGLKPEEYKDKDIHLQN